MTFSLKTLLATSQQRLYGSCIDTVNGFAYFGVDNTPSSILKIRLSDFTELASITPTGTFVDTMSIDVSGDFLYYGSSNVGKTIGKVSLSSFTESAALAGTNSIMKSSVIDVAGGFVYFGQSGGNIQKIRLSDFTNQGNLATGIGQLSGKASLDKTNDFMYFGDTSGNIVKVRISTFSVITTISAGYGLSGTIIDTINGFLYVYGTPSTGTTGRVSKIRLSDFTLVATTSPDFGDNLLSGVIDVANQFAYFGGDNHVPGAPVFQVNLKTFSLVASKNTNRVNSFGTLFSAEIDTTNNNIYFGHYFEKTIAKLGVDILPPIPSGQKKEVLGNTSRLGFTKKGAFINKASGKGASFT